MLAIEYYDLLTHIDSGEGTLSISRPDFKRKKMSRVSFLEQNIENNKKKRMKANKTTIPSNFRFYILYFRL